MRVEDVMAAFSKDSIGILMFLILRKWPSSTAGAEWIDLFPVGQGGGTILRYAYTQLSVIPVSVST